MPGKAIAVNGDAMSYMGRVIAFDLACLASSLSGSGQQLTATELKMVAAM